MAMMTVVTASLTAASSYRLLICPPRRHRQHRRAQGLPHRRIAVLLCDWRLGLCSMALWTN
jgi:hypothetical protein